MFIFYVFKESSDILHGSKFIFNVVNERSVILHGSKQRRSRQNHFRQVDVMKEENDSLPRRFH